MSENTNTERDYPELPNFDSGDESIWEAIFNWQTAQPGADAHRKSLAVEAAIISTLHAYVDEDRKARASLSLPAAGQEPVATVFTMEALAPGGGVKYHATIHKPVPAGTKLYAAPQPAGAQVPEAVLQAIRAAGMHLIRGMNDVYSLIPAMNATAQPASTCPPRQPSSPSATASAPHGRGQ